MSDEMQIVIFFREGMFYPLELPKGEDLAKHPEPKRRWMRKLADKVRTA